MSTVLKNVSRTPVTYRAKDGQYVFIFPRQTWVEEGKISEKDLPKGLKIVTEEGSTQIESDN